MANFILSAFADEFSSDFDSQLEALREAGIDHIELRGIDGKNVSELTPDGAKRVAKKLSGAGISLSAIGSPYGKIKVTDDFEAHLESFRRSMDCAKILGANTYRVFSFYMPNKGDDPAPYKAQVIDWLGRMLDEAERGGMTLAHENEKFIYGDIPSRCRELLDAFGGKLKCVFDPANFIESDAAPSAGYPLLKRDILYFHIKDALMDGGAIVPAGMGDGHIADILSDFGGADTYLTIEPHLTVFEGLKNLQGEEVKHKYSYPTNQDAFRAAVAALKELISSIGYSESASNRWTRRAQA